GAAVLLAAERVPRHQFTIPVLCRVEQHGDDALRGRRSVIKRRRQPAQTFVIAALAMTSMLGALSMVIDAGVYFVIQRQLQNAADAAALAAVWYDPACPSGTSEWLNAGCQSSAQGPVPLNFDLSPP